MVIRKAVQENGKITNAEIVESICKEFGLKDEYQVKLLKKRVQKITQGLSDHQLITRVQKVKRKTLVYFEIVAIYEPKIFISQCSEK